MEETRLDEAGDRVLGGGYWDEEGEVRDPPSSDGFRLLLADAP